jgi:hypothetical protein
LVRAALSGGILGLAIPPASAQHKVPQAEAEYSGPAEKRADLRRLQLVPQAPLLRDRGRGHQPKWLVQIFRSAGLSSANDTREFGLQEDSFGGSLLIKRRQKLP